MTIDDQKDESADRGQVKQEHETPQGPAAVVKTWAAKIRYAKRHWNDQFEQMRADMRFAHGMQWPNQKDHKDNRYVANIVQRHVGQKTAALYAKNPTAIYERRKTLDYTVWDGDPNKVMAAQQIMAQASMLGPQAGAMPQVLQAQELLADVQQGAARQQRLERMGQTLEVVYDHQVKEQLPPFKSSMKQLVRRTIVTGVGYVKLGYHRLYERSPEDVARVTDITEQIKVIERMRAELEDPEVTGQMDKELFELQATLQGIEGAEEMVVREGLDFYFPGSTSVIPDPSCRRLQGFIGCDWIAEEFVLTPADIREVYGVDVGTDYTQYKTTGEAGAEKWEAKPAGDSAEDKDEANKQAGRCLVWRVQQKSTGLTFTICDGYSDFLKAPSPPRVRLERFWDVFVLQFNETEDDENVFPSSDVTLLRQTQMEHNLSRQRLREHRDAARPRRVTTAGALDPEDKLAVQDSQAHDLIELKALQPGQKVLDLLQPLPVNPIDPNLYETGPFTEDMMRTGGLQEANLGGTAGVTATESSIAEASRMTAAGSNVDDLDDFLTELARSASHVLLTELSAETAREIAGIGAMWPEFTTAEVARDLWLVVRAGSSGRPNKAQEIQNFERLAPWLIQIPGISPRWLATEAIERLDDRMSLSDAFLEGMPSIQSMNQQKQVGPGDPQTDPNAQGGAGADNAERPRTDNNQGPNNASARAPDINGDGSPDTAPLKAPGVYR